MIIEHFLFLYTGAIFPPQQLILDWRKVFPFLFLLLLMALPRKRWERKLKYVLHFNAMIFF